jgi:toxin ParE1/3/4
VVSYIVEFSLKAEGQLEALYDYVAAEASALVAKRYTDAIVDYCEGMRTFPHRGARRDDVRPGLRVTNYKGSAVIAFAVDDAARIVTIIGVYYGGQDYESVLQLGLDD